MLSNPTSSILESATTINSAIVTITVGEEDDSNTVDYEGLLSLLQLMSVVSDMQARRYPPTGGIRVPHQ